MLLIKLLVVEDDKNWLASYKFALERRCKILDFATNERDALAMISKNNYDVIITDGAFPEYKGAINFMSQGNCLFSEDYYRGKTIAKAAKKKGIYVIGISAESKKLNCEDIDVLIKKPYDILELFQILDSQPTKEENNAKTKTIKPKGE